MDLMNSLFKNKNKQCSLNSEPISSQTLKNLIPIRNLTDDKLEAFSQKKQTEVLAEGSTLFTIDSPTDAAIYLLKGTITQTDVSGKKYDVSSDSTKARFPICSGNKHTTTAIAKTDISFLRVSHKIMSINNSIDSTELIIPPKLSKNRLLQLFTQHFLEEKPELPSLPKVAIKLRDEMAKNDISIADAVKIIQLDPVISTKLIEVANCPLYLTLKPAKSCLDAVNRIGLNGVRCLVTSFSMKKVFSNQTPLIRKYLDHFWQQSLYLSCISHVLAQESRQQKPEEAQLAGLICDIGVIPFLHFVSDLPTEFHNPDEITQALPAIKGPVGATLLKHWNFSDEFVQVALKSNDWYHNDSEELSLTDIVVLSRLHSKINQGKTSQLPSIIAIPAASKLKNNALSPEHSLQILHEAKNKINEALTAFK